MREDESNNMLQILLHSSKGSSTEGHFTMAFALEEYNALTADKARIRLSCSESCLNVVLLTRAHWRSPVVGWWSLSLHCSCSLENFVYQSQVEANHLAQFLFCQGHEWQELQDWAQNSIDSSTFAQGVVESGIAIYFRIEFHEAWDTRKSLSSGSWCCKGLWQSRRGCVAIILAMHRYRCIILCHSVM